MIQFKYVGRGQEVVLPQFSSHGFVPVFETGKQILKHPLQSEEGGGGGFGAAVTPHVIIKHGGEAVSHSANQPNTIREKPKESRVLHKQTSALIRLHLMCKFFSILILAI